MPGKCKFQVAWLSKDIYKDWLVKDPQDIQLARCKACCKAIKLQTMGEAALTSHAAGCGHKAAVRKLVEGHIMVMNVADHVNGYGNIKDEEEKEPVALGLHLNAFDRLTGSDPPANLEHSVLGGSSASHNASFQEVTFPTSFIDSRGVPSQSSVDCGVPRVQPPNINPHHHPPRLLLHAPQQPPLHHRPPSPARRRCEEPALRDTAPPPKFPRTPRSATAAAAAALARREREQRERVEALEEERVEMLGEQQQQQQEGRREQMESLEWERRMRVLVWEQEVLREKGRAAREKARAYRMKRRYYGAKLKRMGQDVPLPPSSSSSSSGSDQDEWGSGERAPKEGAIV
ncbi:unnamed protein product [Gadus morhua 'NCC']